MKVRNGEGDKHFVLLDSPNAESLLKSSVVKSLFYPVLKDGAELDFDDKII